MITLGNMDSEKDYILSALCGMWRNAQERLEKDDLEEWRRAYLEGVVDTCELIFSDFSDVSIENYLPGLS